MRNSKIRVRDTSQSPQNRGISSLFNMKKIDVFFLIHDTEAMKPFIEKFKGSNKNPGLVHEITETLKDDPAHKEAQFRFGFRIYHDESGQGLPMSRTCELTDKTSKKNIEEFDDAIQTVMTTYESNLFGGMKQAVKDLSSCPGNTKLLFIIGDTGYNKHAQLKKGRTPVRLSYLTKRLKGSEERGTKNIVTFFIQTPNNRKYTKHPERYDQAYQLFREQAHEILKQILPHGSRADDYFFQVDEKEFTSRIIASIKGFSNTQALNGLVLDVRGGTGLKDLINRLQGSKEYNNIPAVFWNIDESSSEGDIHDAVLDAYIPVSEDIVEDVWMTSSDLESWVFLLRSIGDQTHLGGSKLREAFVFSIKDALEKVVRKPLYDDPREPLGEYLKHKAGLPVRDDSPLFQYSLYDLEDKNKVPDCELIRLATWVNNVRQMLSIISHGDMRPEFTKEILGGCPKGNDIPLIFGDIKRTPLGKSPDMRFDHNFQKAHIYWVPKEYLP